MTLSGSTRIGPYEILCPIGSGGMGEVYKARDPRLGRDVAIKILPASYAGSEDRLARFEQEARAAGVLNHPNVVAVYDIGQFEGSPYVVTELLEGETLRARLKNGPLPPRRALEYATQIARGLAAAHEKGIVHRDIKPENIFVTRDGRVKILDFGLAKVSGVAPGAGVDSDVVTLLAHTNPGVVMGTVGYMSPEQVRGLPVDHRSDVFSFGAVLYEMVTGERAFHGDSAVEVMNSILKEEPAELTSFTGVIPPGLDRLVRHCLEKSPDHRFQSTSDLAFDLEALSLYSGSGAVVSGAAPRARRRVPLVPIAFALGIALTLAAGFLAGSSYEAASGRATPSFEQLTFRRGKVTSARFAPDGQTVIYTAAWDGKAPEMFLARPGNPESRSYDLADAHILSVSKSGELAILHNKTLSRMAFTGGAPRGVLERVAAADWAPERDDLAVAHWVENRYRLEYPIGNVLFETDGGISSLRFAPDGQSIAFLHHTIQGDDRGSVMLVDLAGNARPIAESWTSLGGLAWAADGSEIWFAAAKTGANRALYAADLKGSTRLIVDVAGSLMLHDVGAGGQLLVSRDTVRSEVVGNASDGGGEINLSWLDGSVGTDISNDGSVLLFSEQVHGGGTNYSAYVRKTDGSPAVRIGEGTATALSPDGRWALSILPTSPPRLMLLPTGPGEPRALVDGVFEQCFQARFFPDGQRVLISAAEAGKRPRLYSLEIATGSIVPLTPEGLRGTLLSPDGRRVAVLDNATAAWSLFELETGASTPLQGLNPGDVPIRFSDDGKSIFLRESKNFPVRIHRLDVVTGRRQLVAETQPADMTGVSPYPTRVVVTPDGKRFAYSFGRYLSELFLVDGLAV